ncbi:hypothetical protein, partial [Enterobacter cloacae]
PFKKGSMMNMNPFYTSHRIGQPILKRSALGIIPAFFYSWLQCWCIVFHGCTEAPIYGCGFIQNQHRTKLESALQNSSAA